MMARALLICTLIIPLVLRCLTAEPVQLSASFPSDIAASKTVFDKCVEVFGLRVLATSGVSEAKILLYGKRIG